MRYRVQISKKAEADIDEALAWFWEQLAAEAGERWLVAIWKAIETLESQPDRFSLAAETEQFGLEVREEFSLNKQIHSLVRRGTQIDISTEPESKRDIVGKTQQVFYALHAVDNVSAVNVAEVIVDVQRHAIRQPVLVLNVV